MSKAEQVPRTSLTAQLHERPYLWQWARVLRWGERVRSEQATTDVQTAFDFQYALFGCLFDMRDWIIASRPDLKPAALAAFQDPDLALVRDIANGAKHMTLTRYGVLGEATLMREYMGPGAARMIVPNPDGRNIDSLALARRAIDKVSAFMATHDLHIKSSDTGLRMTTTVTCPDGSKREISG